MSTKVMETYLNSLKSKKSRLGTGMQNQQNIINSNLALTDEYMSNLYSGMRTGNASASARYAMLERSLQGTQGKMSGAYQDMFSNYNKDMGTVLDEEARVQSLIKQQEEADRKAEEQNKTGLGRLGLQVAGFAASLIPGVGAIAPALSNIFGGALSVDRHGNPEIDVNKMDLNQIGTGLGELAYGVSNIASEKKLKAFASETGMVDTNKLYAKFKDDPTGFAFWNAERDRLLRAGDLEAYKNFISEFYKDIPDVSGWQPEYQPVPTFGG